MIILFVRSWLKEKWFNLNEDALNIKHDTLDDNALICYDYNETLHGSDWLIYLTFDNVTLCEHMLNWNCI